MRAAFNVVRKVGKINFENLAEKEQKKKEQNKKLTGGYCENFGLRITFF